MATAGSDEQGIVLTLFIADQTPSSLRARRHVQEWLDRNSGEPVSVSVVDVFERPDLAEQERVLATPTLVRHSPLPRRKLVGDLADWEVEATVWGRDPEQGETARASSEASEP